MSRALQEFTRISRYSRYRPDLMRRETWSEQVDRVFGMHKAFFADRFELIADEFAFAQAMVLEKKVLPSMRSLQFGGPSVLRKHARMYNCSATFVDRPRAFQEIMWLLLCGTGVGFSVQTHHIAKLPDIAPLDNTKTVLHIAEDSIEGWADCLGAMLSSYFVSDQPFPQYFGKRIEFDLSNIRPKGSPISDMGGTAPGSAPLKNSLANIEKLLQRCVKNGQTRLKPIDAMDIICHASDSVLAGGIRRSALITVFSAHDSEMVNAKTGNWFMENGQRGRSNNSALLLRDKVSKEEFNTIIESVKTFGEPGFIWSDDTEVVFNPCVPADTRIMTDTGLKQVSDLIGIPFTAVVEGKHYQSRTGFVKTGTRRVFKVSTEEGYELRATENHKIMTYKGWVEMQYLCNNMLIKLANPVGPNLYATVIAVESDEVCDVYDATVDGIHAFDANGMYVHNCAEISLYPVDELTGNTGTQMCNLTEINSGALKTEQDFYEACKASAIIGTFQAAYTKFGYLGAIAERVVEREALLGCSMTGIMENPSICMNPSILRKGASIIKEVNKIVAAKLGINPAARTTAVKPAGSTSCLLGSSSGIHPAHSRKYFRRVQVNKLEGPQAFFSKYNPDAIENSVWSANQSDNVITFLCETPADALTNVDLTAVDFLKFVKLVQENWVNEGRDLALCVKPWLQHNVSNTVTVKPSEWGDVASFIYENRKNFTGISILPSSGDKTYKQAPFESILNSAEIIAEFGDGAIFSSGLIVHALQSFNNDLFDACDAIMGFGLPLVIPDLTANDAESHIEEMRIVMDKMLFVKRAKKFAIRYFSGDLQRMCYCLKSVNSWKRWCDLKRSYVDVPWELFHETDAHAVSDNLACAGGQCELVRM